MASTNPIFAKQIGGTYSPQLLVSVQNADEARVAQLAGVDWIDLKNPSAGPLGGPDLATAQSVASILQDHSKRSAALGELLAIDLQRAILLSSMFPVLKVGLSGCAAPEIAWKNRLRSVAQQISPLAQLVPVIYADYEHCEAPDPIEVIDQAVEIGSEWLLIDTFAKSGSNLLDYLAIDELERLSALADAQNVSTVFAGSLTLECTRQLLPLNPAVIAVRGAVCESGRRSALSAPKIEQWLRLLQPSRFLERHALGEPLG